MASHPAKVRLELPCGRPILYQIMHSGSEGPVTVPEDGNHPTVPGVGVNVHGVTANHEVLVDHGVIDAVAAALLQGLVLEVPDGIGVAHAQGQDHEGRREDGGWKE